ncbi:MAG: tetratricopeptide repeat protein [Bryobacteraceae bacterium]
MIKSVFSGPALWISLALIAASVFIYAPVRDHSFVTWDDPQYVSDNLHVAAGLTWDGLRWAFTTGYMANWHPLTWLSYMVDVQLFGVSAPPHLIVNLLIHTLNALLLFGLFHEMTGAAGRSGFVAALFATHPLHVESVAWVAERKDVLSMLFGLLALWAYLAYTRRPGPMRYLTVLLLFALGLMAKPMLVTLPLVMLLLDYWPLRRLALDRRDAVLRLLLEKLPLLAVAAISSVITFVTQRGAGAVRDLTRLPLNLRVENAVVAYAAYIGKMLWPARLAALYPLTHWAPGVVLGSGLLLVAVSVAVIWEAQRRPYLPVGWLWYLGTLVPVIGLVQVGAQSMADRYTYLPLIGLFLALGWLIPDLLADWPQRKILLPAAAGILILACAVTARAQVQYWKDGTALWTRVLEVDPDSETAHTLLGDALARQGRFEEAMAHDSAALRLNADDRLAHKLLGEALAKQGRFQEAIPEYSAALRLKPDDAEAHNGLGLALASRGRFDEAAAHYREAFRLQPTLVDAHYNLGLSLASQGKTDEAIGQYREALRIDPGFVKAHNNLGVALASQGKTDEAISEFSAVLHLTPDNPDAHNNLGILLASKGRLDEAIAHFSDAVRLKPDFTAALNNLNTARSKQAAGTGSPK